MFIIPYSQWILQSSPTIPKLYWSVTSQEQRIAEICRRIGCLEGYANYLAKTIGDMQDDFAREIAQLASDIRAELAEAIDDIMTSVDDDIQELREWVMSQSFAQGTWDVTRGLRTDAIDGMRRMFADVTVEGTTVDELALSTKYPTVDSLASSGYNVRALAVRGAWMLDEPNPNQWTA